MPIYRGSVATSAATGANPFVITGPSSRIVPGATSLSIRNNANTLDHLLITNAGVTSILPDSATGINSGSIVLGTTSQTQTVPDDTTTVQFLNISQNFSGTTNTPTGNSARLVVGSAHWVDGTNDVGTMSGGYFFAYNDSVRDVQDLIGVIGRVYQTSTGNTSVGMWGVRGDVNLTGAAIITGDVAALEAHQGSWSAAATAPTYSGLHVNTHDLSTGGAVITDGYGALIAIPTNATGNNVGVMVGARTTGTISSLGLFVGTGGAWFRGSAPGPIANTTSTTATIALIAGNNAATNTPLCALYYYRSTSTMAYVGFDSDTSTIAGHTKSVTDYLIAPNNQRAVLVDSGKNLWVAGTIASGGTIINNHVPAAINSTNTATAAQAAAGYITSTSAAPTTITLPTGTALGTQLGATQGTTLYLTIDNTAGSNTVTVAVAVNGILSADAVANAASAGLLTIPSGVTGQGTFMLMFSSATAYTFTRVA